MKASRLNPELRRIFRFVPNPPVTTSAGRSVINGLLKRVKTPSQFDGVSFNVVTLANGQPARIFSPPGSSPPDRGKRAALLNIHGGGMVIGKASQDDVHMADVARDLGIVVVSIEYRLAPQSPFPAALDDCFFAWNALLESAVDVGVDPARIAIGGQSAGGGLAAALVQRIHDQGGVQPVAQWLFCPMLDDRTAGRRELDAVRHRLWNNKSNRAGWKAYLGQEPGAADLPPYAAAARRTDLTGLPAAWIGMGDIELFYGEGRTYAAALRDAGVDCTLDIVPGAPHAFETIAATTRLATDYKARAHAWLRNRLGV